MRVPTILQFSGCGDDAQTTALLDELFRNVRELAYVHYELPSTPLNAIPFRQPPDSYTVHTVLTHPDFPIPFQTISAPQKVLYRRTV